MRLGLVSAGLTLPEGVTEKEAYEELKELEKQLTAAIDSRSESEKRDIRQQHKLAVKYSNRKIR